MLCESKVKDAMQETLNGTAAEPHFKIAKVM